jgi:hypothetical protein
VAEGVRGKRRSVQMAGAPLRAWLTSSCRGPVVTKHNQSTAHGELVGPSTALPPIEFIYASPGEVVAVEGVRGKRRSAHMTGAPLVAWLTSSCPGPIVTKHIQSTAHGELVGSSTALPPIEFIRVPGGGGGGGGRARHVQSQRKARTRWARRWSLGSRAATPDRL